MASVLTSLNDSRVAVSATKLLINNRWIASESGKTFATVNPSTGEEICQIAEADAADVEKAVEAARQPSSTVRGARRWRRNAGRLLHRLADLIEKNADELARLEALDNGKPVCRGEGGGRGRDGRLLPLFRRLGRQDSRQDHPHRRRLLLLHAPRAGGRGGTDHSLEFPHADAGLEARAGAGHRQYGGDEAGRTDAAVARCASAN